jgi:arylsulfatase
MRRATRSNRAVLQTFDVGEDTGTPVLEEYEDKMPFRFTGTLKRFVAVLEPLTGCGNS